MRWMNFYEENQIFFVGILDINKLATKKTTTNNMKKY